MTELLLTMFLLTGQGQLAGQDGFLYHAKKFAHEASYAIASDKTRTAALDEALRYLELRRDPDIENCFPVLSPVGMQINSEIIWLLYEFSLAKEAGTDAGSDAIVALLLEGEDPNDGVESDKERLAASFADMMFWIRLTHGTYKPGRLPQQYLNAADGGGGWWQEGEYVDHCI